MSFVDGLTGAWNTAPVLLTERTASQRAEVGKRERSSWWAAGFGAMLGAALFLGTHRALTDDAYISLAYAVNLAELGHWGLLSDRGANTATSPLNVWLLAASSVVTGRPVVSAGLLLVATLAVCCWWADAIRRHLGLSQVMPYVLVALLATSPLLASTVGLETLLGVALLVGITRYAMAGRPVVAGVICGLAVLCRPDLAVPAGVLVLVLLPGRRWALVAGMAGLVALPWHLFAWVVLGGFVPNTLWIKTSTTGDYERWGSLVTAPVILGRALPSAMALTAVPVAAGLLCAAWAVVRRRQPWAQVTVAFATAGWAHWLALVAIGAFPQVWYFAPLVSCSACAVTVAVACMRIRVPMLTVAGALCAASVVVAGPVPWVIAPFSTNWATTQQYQTVAAQLPALTGGRPVRGPGEIGVLALHSAVPVRDHLSDPAYARRYLDARHEIAGPVLQAFLQWNWTHRPDQPAPTDRYRLTYASYEPAPPGRLIHTWPIATPSHGPDLLVLTELPPSD